MAIPLKIMARPEARADFSSFGHRLARARLYIPNGQLTQFYNPLGHIILSYDGVN
jgi:hypothetical protein